MTLYTRIVLTAIAACLAVLTLDRLAQPGGVRAQSETDLYIEPGYTMLRKLDGSTTVLGKVVINRRTGDIWGFPTGNESPYPLTPTRKEPPVSRPMYLGKFDFSAVGRVPE
jgi:hypothetical protein